MKRRSYKGAVIGIMVGIGLVIIGVLILQLLLFIWDILTKI